MRALLALLALGACTPTAPGAGAADAVSSASVASESATVEVAVIGAADGSVALVSVVDDGPVALDRGRPARFVLGGAAPVEAPMLDDPSMRRMGDRTATGASYRIETPLAREMARGGPLEVELSVGGTYRRFRATRSDLLE